MFKEIFNTTSADYLSSIALVIFCSVFFLVTGWILTRRKTTVQKWANMPLEDDTPVDPRPGHEADTRQTSHS